MDTFAALFDGLYNILNAPSQFLVPVEVPDQLEDFAAEGVVGNGGGDGRVVEGLVELGFHVDKLKLY